MEGGFLVKEGIRREYKKQYDASTKRIDVVDVPEFNFLMVDGIGNPNVEELELKADALHILSKAIKDYFKDNPVVLDLGEIIFVPDNKKVNKLSYVGTPYYPSNTLYPADDLFLKESKDIYEDLDNAESLDIFGVSPYGDKSLINKLMKIPQITIYVHNLNELEIMEWKKSLPWAIFKDSSSF